MTMSSANRAWRSLAMAVFLVPLSIFPVLDWIRALPGVSMYANWEQFAWIFFWYCVIHATLALALVCLASVFSLAVSKVTGSSFNEVYLRACAGLVHALLFFALGIAVTQWANDLWELTSSQLAWTKWLMLVMGVGVALLMAYKGKIGNNLRSAMRLGASITAIAFLLSIATIVYSRVASRAPQPSSSEVLRHTDEPPAPVILITIDTLSAKHLSMYGYHRNTSPNLANFADHATLFLRNYANSNFTTPSMASIALGARPWSHRAIQLEAEPNRKNSEYSLPSQFMRHGYHTISVSTNAHASPGHLNISKYFDREVINAICHDSLISRFAPYEFEIAINASPILYRLNKYRFLFVSGCNDGKQYDPSIAFAEAIRLIDEAPSGKPFFLWVHLLPPHDPYVSPSPFLGSFNPSQAARDRASTLPPSHFDAIKIKDFPGILVDRYDEAISYVDHGVGVFLDTLKQRGLFDRGLIVISADHGESFTKGYGGHGGPLAHDELTRVPLLIKEPHQKSPSVVNELSEQVDYLPTILDLVGLKTASSEGVSLVPTMRGESLDRPVFTMNFQQSPARGKLHTGTVAMIQGRWKYIHHFGHIRYPNMPILQDALYDVIDDPEETLDASRANPNVAAHMLATIQLKLTDHDGKSQP